MKKSLITLAIGSALMVAPQIYSKSDKAGKFSKEKFQNYVPGELIIKFKDGISTKSLNTKSIYGNKIKKSIDILAGNFAVLRVDQKRSLENLIEELNQDPRIEYAEPNYIYHSIGQKEKTLTADPKFDELWGLVNTGHNEPRTSSGQNSSPRGVAGVDVNAKDAWTITKGDRAIKIAVIDTGVDYNHPDLKNNMWTNTAEANGTPGVDDDGNGYIDDIHGYDFANKDGDPMDGNGHGTHCAGTIAAEHDNGVGIAGVMADAQIVGIKFLTDQGSGSTADAILAIDYATKIGVDIMSNSWGGGGASQALEDSIKRANAAGIIFTAAAGNSATDNNTKPHYPSNYNVENVISVAAHNYNNNLATFSCYGSRTVHVAAPGRNILSTTPNSGYSVYSGTSMATPHVTGVIGLYLAEHGRTNPKFLRDKLMESSVYGAAYDKKIISQGRVDAYNFLTGVVADRPERPDPSEWQTTSVERFESTHKYENNLDISKTYTIPGAKFIRVRVRKHAIEENYDALRILDAAGNEAEKIDGMGENTISEYVSGDSITVNFTSDASVVDWGFLIEEVDYILE